MEQQRNTNCWYAKTCSDDCTNCATYIQLKWQMENSGLPKIQQEPIALYINESNEVDEQAYIRLAEIRSDIVDFVEGHKNLYICSEYTGNGKTSWAIKMLHTYFHYTAGGNYDNLKGMFVSVADLLLRLKDFKNPVDKAYKDNLENVDLIVWDDIGLSNISQYDYTQLYTIINNRMFSGKSNIFTSNCTTQEKLLELVGDKLASRIWNTSEIIEFKGGDIR